MDARMLKALPRAQIQKLAKRDGIKANSKSEEIIRQLVAKYPGGVPRLVASVPKRMRSVQKASTSVHDVMMSNSGEVEGKPNSVVEEKASRGSENTHNPVDYVMANGSHKSVPMATEAQTESSKTDFLVNSASSAESTKKPANGPVAGPSGTRPILVAAGDITNSETPDFDSPSSDDIKVSLAEVAAKRAAKGKGRASALDLPLSEPEDSAAGAQECASQEDAPVTAAAVMEMLGGVIPLSAEEFTRGEHVLEQAAAIAQDVEARGPLPPVTVDAAMKGARQQELSYDRAEVVSSFVLDLASNNMQGLMDKGLRMMRGIPSPRPTQRVEPTGARSERAVSPTPMEDLPTLSEVGTASMSISGATVPPPRRGPTKERTKEVLRELAHMTTEMSELQEELDEVQTLTYLSLRRCVNMQEVLQKVRSWRKLLEREYFAKMKIDPRLTNGLEEWEGPEQGRTFDPMVTDVSDPLSSSAFEVSNTSSKSDAIPGEVSEEQQGRE